MDGYSLSLYTLLLERARFWVSFLRWLAADWARVGVAAARARAHSNAINLRIPPEPGALLGSFDRLAKRFAASTTRDLKVVDAKNRLASRSKLPKLERARFWD
jgi:hypothetical protein